ncbi:SlyX family protein [Aestuariirhabdus litorea]|uniref:Protein SlyX homolog n=1 Tax=Aestuariirhabdus litorea TaxID=2528527 RepID=A0A3P3VN86_9GAMM|nr:SlyX family protein [Aestuariirhabdus litorea]RRJ84165.1 hypothetical protein D0544_03325 [Aestuariirhabdus litorea]RWW97385.1 SlyX family protein [Endozoicomonadaceae bacterium GTF-13]
MTKSISQEQDVGGLSEQLSSQLVELQTQLAFQEDTIDALNAVVTRQQQQIDRMAVQLESLKKRFESLPDTLGEEVPDQPPPHY